MSNNKPWFVAVWETAPEMEIDWEIIQGFVDMLAPQIGFVPGARILDVACGRAVALIELAGRGAEAVGIDRSEAMLAAGRNFAAARNVEIEWLCADMRELGYDNEFDIVMIRDVIFGIFDHDTNMAVLQSLVRALKSGGRLHLQVYNKDHALNHKVENMTYNADIGRFENRDYDTTGTEAGEYQFPSIELMTIPEWRGVLAQLSLAEINLYTHKWEPAANDSRFLNITAKKV
ncbi:class I SAM-dependent methyltransferase [Planctomycetota bacterium]